MSYETGVKQHHNMAMGDGVMGGTDFGCKPMDHSKGPKMGDEGDMKRGHVGDGEKRGAKPPMASGGGKFGKQAAPDHGPHGKR